MSSQIFIRIPFISLLHTFRSHVFWAHQASKWTAEQTNKRIKVFCFIYTCHLCTLFRILPIFLSFFLSFCLIWPKNSNTFISVRFFFVHFDRVHILRFTNSDKCKISIRFLSSFHFRNRSAIIINVFVPRGEKTVSENCASQTNWQYSYAHTSDMLGIGWKLGAKANHFIFTSRFHVVSADLKGIILKIWKPFDIFEIEIPAFLGAGSLEKRPRFGFVVILFAGWFYSRVSKVCIGLIAYWTETSRIFKVKNQPNPSKSI